MYGISLSVQLNISQVSAVNERSIKLSMRRDILYLQTIMYYFVYYIDMVITKFLVIFQRFLITFRESCDNYHFDTLLIFCLKITFGELFSKITILNSRTFLF